MKQNQEDYFKSIYEAFGPIVMGKVPESTEEKVEFWTKHYEGGVCMSHCKGVDDETLLINLEFSHAIDTGNNFGTEGENFPSKLQVQKNAYYYAHGVGEKPYQRLLHHKSCGRLPKNSEAEVVEQLEELESEFDFVEATQKSKKDYPLFKNGTRVRTTHENESLRNEWTSEAKRLRRWNAPGTVVDQSDSHGLCYGVKHEDGITAYYDPSELKVLP